MYLKKIILSTLIIFLITEIFLNLINFRPSNKNYGWLDAHNTYSNFIKDIEKNEFGTRDINSDKRKKIPNIILLGDSQVELGQKSSRMPARILEKKLEEKYNVYSLGSWGWGNDQQLLILKKTIKKLNPKYTIVFFTLNDLENNYNNIGFKGEKPTFKITDDFIISEPKYNFIKSILNYSWTYRTIYRIYLYSKLNNYQNFIDDESFITRRKCEEKNFIEIEELLNNYSNYNYLRQKHIKTLSAKGENILKEKEFKEQIYELLITKNRYKPRDDKLFYFRDIKTKDDNKQIYLTNFLLNKIQNLSKDNGSKFILLHVVNKNYYFPSEENYSICISDRIVSYSNKYFSDFLNQVFNGIENIITFNIEKGYEEYDLIDGHLNYELNSKVFLEVANKIKELKK